MKLKKVFDTIDSLINCSRVTSDIIYTWLVPWGFECIIPPRILVIRLLSKDEKLVIKFEKHHPSVPRGDF